MENKTIEAKLGDKQSNLWGYHFIIPEDIANHFTDGKDRRIVVTFNGKIKNHCAIMPSPEGHFIMLNKGIVKKLQIETGEVVTIEIEKDTSEYGMPICEEFEAVIFGDEEVFAIYQKLTPGKQRNLIHLVNKIKSSDIKINRAMAIGEYLVKSKGIMDFRKLNEKIKEFNQKSRIVSLLL